MINIAAKTKIEPTLEFGLVTQENKEGYTVRTDETVFEAQRAAGCLLKPEPGDRVVLASGDQGLAWVLAVLERPDSGPVKEIRMTGPVAFRVDEGDLDLAADGRLSLAAPEFQVDAGSGQVRIEEFTWVGGLIRAQAQRLRFVADTVDSVCRRLVQKLTSSYRYVEGHEEVQSASSRMLVEGTLTLQTKNTMHTSEGHIKMDARQIHLG